MRILDLILAAGVGAAAVLLLGGGGAADAQQLTPLAPHTRGATRAGDVKEIYSMATRLRSDGGAKTVKEERERRDVFFVPEHFGDLIDVTSADGTTTFWYRDGDGKMRNAVIATARSKLIRVDRAPTEKFRFDYR